MMLRAEFFQFIVPVQTSAIWVKIHISDEVLPFGLCLTYLYWISNFAFLCSIPYDLLVLFLSILPRWTGRNMCPSAVRGIGFLHGNCQALFFLSPPPWIFILFPGIVLPPWNLSYFQAFSDLGTANSGCNGDATLKSVFNFWKNQVVGWLTSNKVQFSIIFLAAFFDTNLLGFEQDGAGKRIGGAHCRNRPGSSRVGDNILVPMQY